MNVTCSDRERIFEDGTPAEWAALEAHAATCAICAEELRAWKALSVTAEELRDYTANPAFWPRIERALAERGQRGRSIVSEEQGPEGSGERGNRIRTGNRQARRGSQAAARQSRDAAARELSRETPGAGQRHRRPARAGGIESLECATALPVAGHVPGRAAHA